MNSLNPIKHEEITSDKLVVDHNIELTPYNNTFAEILRKECKLSIKDTLISATQYKINNQLGFIKLDDNEII